MKKMISILLAIALFICNLTVVTTASGQLEENVDLKDALKTQLSEEQTAVTEVTSEEEQEEEKGAPCTATIDDEFTEDKVLVTIIKELSRTRESFTAEDFPGVDIKEVRVILSYLEETDCNVTVGITLNNGTKQKVLDSIKILEQNPIVYSACPNYIFKLLN